MIAPALAAHRFLLAVLLGAVLGVVYGFLRPLRPRHKTLSDILFFPAAVWVWMYFALAVCRGDLRLGYVVGMGLGGVIWELTFGKWLRPIFSLIWKIFSRVFTFLILPGKIFFKKIGFFVKKDLQPGKNGLY